MFILTLQFDFKDVKPRGRFSGDATKPPTGPLTTSMNWLKLRPDELHPEPGFPVPAAFNVETANWEDLGEAGTLLIPRPDPQVIGIYVRQDRDKTAVDDLLDDDATVQLAVNFGRPTRANQPQASPFTDNREPTGPVKTTFISEPQRKDGREGWFFELDKVAIRPDHPNLTHRYEFSVGIIVKDVTNNVTRYYGQDPEMDIGP